MAISKDSFIELYSKITALSQSLLKMFPNIDDEMVRDPHQDIEQCIGVFLASLIRIGSGSDLNEARIRQVVTDVLNAHALPSDGVDFQRYSEKVTPVQREQLEPMFKRMYGMGVDLPDHVSVDDTPDANIVLTWNNNRRHAQGNFHVEFTLRKDGFAISSLDADHPFNRVSISETPMSLLEDREFFVKYGLAVDAVLADRFNPLRYLGK